MLSCFWVSVSHAYLPSASLPDEAYHPESQAACSIAGSPHNHYKYIPYWYSSSLESSSLVCPATHSRTVYHKHFLWCAAAPAPPVASGVAQSPTEPQPPEAAESPSQSAASPASSPEPPVVMLLTTFILSCPHGILRASSWHPWRSCRGRWRMFRREVPWTRLLHNHCSLLLRGLAEGWKPPVCCEGPDSFLRQLLRQLLRYTCIAAWVPSMCLVSW
jgi:hypothetical protein